jgi:hypothetical protein
VIDNAVWTDSWPSIAGAGCGLICIGTGEEWARKVYALRGFRGVERQVGLTRGTRWPAGSSAGSMVARKARRSRRPEPVQGSGSRLESARRVCGGSPENRWVTWLSHKTKTGGSAGGDGIRARREASMPADLWRDRRACVGSDFGEECSHVPLMCDSTSAISVAKNPVVHSRTKHIEVRLLTVQNRAQVHRKPTGDLVPFSPRRVLPRFVNPRIGSKPLRFSI